MNITHFYLFAFVLIVNIAGIFSADVYININLDYVNDGAPSLKVYKTPVEVSDCPNFEKQTEGIFLKLHKNMTSTICNVTGVIFHVFVYNSSITTALVIVENKNYNSDYITNQLSKVPHKILNIQSDYITIVICQSTQMPCSYRGIDSREALRGTNLVIYSLCKGTSTDGSCLTIIEYSSEYTDIEKNSEILGTNINMVKSNLEPEYSKPLKCLNGGILKQNKETKKMQCACPKSNAFVDSGPRCEVLQQDLNKKQYFYSLPNANSLSIEFSLYSLSFQDSVELFTIHDQKGSLLMRYNIQDTNIITSIWGNVSITYVMDTSRWVDVSILLSNGSFNFKINGKEEKTPITNFPSNGFQLDTIPIIFLRNGPIRDRICLSNLKINSRFVDLNTPGYSPCTPNFKCQQCDEDQKCYYTPLKSDGLAACFCEPGYMKMSDTKCHKNPTLMGQIPVGRNVSIVINDVQFQIAILKFRTLLTNGTLVTFMLPPIQINIGIANGLIYSSFLNTTTNISFSGYIPYYNVSDGAWHDVTIECRNYMMSLTIDDKQPFNSFRVLFDQSFISPNTLPGVKTLIFGPLHGAADISSNRSVCFDTVSFISFIPSTSAISDGWSIFYTPLNESLREGCDNGINCSSLSCTDNRKCVESWQNTSCVCDDKFTDQNGTCSFTQCLSKPCKNGLCYFDSSTQDFGCQCFNNFSGRYCDELPVVLATWWFISLMVLLILVIIIVLVLLFFRKKKQNSKTNSKLDINCVYENTVECHTQAGETDHQGSIDMNALRRSAVDERPTKEVASDSDPNTLHQELKDRKEHFDIKNDDLVLDYPLDYGYEGSDGGASISSFGTSGYNEDFS